jgi:S1-C subfamily serine protease
VRRALAALAAFVCAAAVAGCDEENGGGTPYRVPSGAQAAKEAPVPKDLGRDGFDAQRIYEAVAPGVVTVEAHESGGVLSGPGGQGSGFVLDTRGYIATNAHVIRSAPPSLDRADEVYVDLADGSRLEAEIVGDDLFADVALLRIDPTALTLTPLELGSTKSLKVGAPVAAIGSPFGEVQSQSVGTISALDRSIDSLTDYKIGDAVQTDAAINPGSSGGPLIDAQGRVIGINAQIQTTSGGDEGVGFAVPVDTVRRSLAQLREFRRVRYAYLGVSAQDLYPQLAERLGISATVGALVVRVDGGGPADDAGIEAGDDEIEFQGEDEIPTGGDVIVAIAGERVLSSSDVGDIVAGRRPGDSVRVELVRGSVRRTVTVQLGQRDPRPSGE